MFDNKSILITGGTGSFGKKFTQTVLQQFPNVKKIVIYSRDEYKQFVMQNMPEFKAHQNKMRYFIGDVRDKDRLTMALENIDIVIHAAALKQVPACEYNPFEAVKTNIIGAQNVIEAALKTGVEKVIALSTDKASSPINLYGATKLCSDKLFIAANSYSGSKDIRFAVVRYGNVAGSRGSVIPFFKQLVASGADKIPITHSEMTRFWLKLEDAVWMVFNALERMHGGELYVKKTPSVLITDLAKVIAPDLPLHNCGIRPGEKIHEQMIAVEEARHTLEFDNYFVIQPEATWWEDSGAREKIGGRKVDINFSYNSGDNKDWLSPSDMTNLVEELHV
jgi:UDP-N-acetylglucosamine 4,6-dehydratase/5-epimerase